MILNAVERAWRERPDARLGQLLSNLAPEQPNLFQIEDGELLRRIGPETEEERRYVEREPDARREGWGDWMARGTDAGGSP